MIKHHIEMKFRFNQIVSFFRLLIYISVSDFTELFSCDCQRHYSVEMLLSCGPVLVLVPNPDPPPQVVGFLQWMLVACVNHWANPAYGWVLFVAVTLWILTTVLFFVLLFSVQQKMAFVPWPMTVRTQKTNKNKRIQP